MNNEFTEPIDELKRVAEEINLLRRDIQAASAALGRIERRLKAAFPKYPSKRKQPKEGKRNERPHSLKTSQELNAIFEDLVSHTKAGGDNAYSTNISELNTEDIVALAGEMGIGSPSRISRQRAIDSIRKRIQEAMQLQFEKKQNP